MFVRVPKKIEAVQVPPDSNIDLTKLNAEFAEMIDSLTTTRKNGSILVRTGDGTFVATPGDWITMNPSGGLSMIRNAVFQDNYREIEGEDIVI